MTSNAMTITELSKLIATLTPQSKLTNAISYAFSTTSLSTKESTIVYTTFVMISGDTIGNVTFQNVSYPVAPSIFATSYNAPGTDCSAAIKIMICTPDACTMSKIRPTAAVI